MPSVQQTTQAESLVRDFIFQKFPLARQRDVSNDDSLLEGGLIDSLGLLDVVMFLESQFEITLEDDDMVSDHFDSIASISRLVEERLT